MGDSFNKQDPCAVWGCAGLVVIIIIIIIFVNFICPRVGAL